jgi:hypothetical protein
LIDIYGNITALENVEENLRLIFLDTSPAFFLGFVSRRPSFDPETLCIY